VTDAGVRARAWAASAVGAKPATKSLSSEPFSECEPQRRGNWYFVAIFQSRFLLVRSMMISVKTVVTG
jgi:hypothetical protein